jgi:hypothetical protein
VIETAGVEFCPYHLRLAKEYGAERVRRGAVPKKWALGVVRSRSRRSRYPRERSRQ